MWKDSLLPLVIQADRKTDRKELVTIDGFWRPKGGRETFSRLDHFLLKNTSKETLKHVVVELLATNQWGGKAKHYYYFPTIAIGAENRLLAHPRWDKRNLDFTNTIELTYSVWADSGSDMDRSATLTNPRPNPDPEGWRRDFLKGDQLLAGEWEKYDLFARKGFPEPVASQ